MIEIFAACKVNGAGKTLAAVENEASPRAPSQSGLQVRPEDEHVPRERRGRGWFGQRPRRIARVPYLTRGGVIVGVLLRLKVRLGTPFLESR